MADKRVASGFIPDGKKETHAMRLYNGIVTDYALHNSA
jgi:hypothetical protein